MLNNCSTLYRRRRPSRALAFAKSRFFQARTVWHPGCAEWQARSSSNPTRRCAMNKTMKRLVSAVVIIADPRVNQQTGKIAGESGLYGRYRPEAMAEATKA